MKGRILIFVILCFFSLVFLSFSISKRPFPHIESIKTFDSSKYKFYRYVEKKDYGIVVFDSCEYITQNAILSHKGNCKYCKERNKVK